MKTFKSNSIISCVLLLVISVLILSGCGKVPDGGSNTTSLFRVIVSQIDTAKNMEECLKRCAYCMLPCDPLCQSYCNKIQADRVIVSPIDAQDSTLDSETSNMTQGSLNIVTVLKKAYSIKNALNKERVNMAGNMAQFNEASDKLDSVIFELDIMYKESILKKQTKSPLLKTK